MDTAELKKTIDLFFEIQEQNEDKMLREANTIADLIGLILKDSVGNGFRRAVLQKAKQIIEEIEDPRILWHDLETMSTYPSLEGLRSCVVSKTAVLIATFSYKSVPQWFVDLLQNPQHIPEDFLAIVCKKAGEIQNILRGRISDSTEAVIRTVEKGRC